MIKATTIDTERLQPTAARERTERPREVEGIYSAPGLHWVGDGFRVRGYFSSVPDAVRKLDPFLLLDYHPEHSYAPSTRPRGVGVHPHRGFETVTLAWQGSVQHHDSAGGGGIIGPGDVQWMTAASGVLHKEYHEVEFAKRGGPFQMAQLWVNLPRAHKMDPPRYQALTAGQMGEVTLPDGAGVVRVIAGELAGVRGPAKTFSPIAVYDARVNRDKRFEFSVPSGHTVALLILKGEIEAGQRTAKADDLVLFSREGERVSIDAREESHVLVLSGEPLKEPVVQYGPFVMNTEREIEQAFVDLSRGAFGRLDD